MHEAKIFTTKAAKSVRWDRLHDVFRFRIHRHRRYAYWVRATDLAPDEIASTLDHLRSKAWWTATHERDLRRAIERRRRDLRKPTMAMLHKSTEQRLVGLIRCGFARWAVARLIHTPWWRRASARH